MKRSLNTIRKPTEELGEELTTRRTVLRGMQVAQRLESELGLCSKCARSSVVIWPGRLRAILVELKVF